jgi:hypothetical protein
MPPLPIRRGALLTTAALLLAACGGDDGPAGPSANFSLDGAWTYNVSNAKFGTTTCSAGPYTLTFASGAGTIAASAATKLACVISGQSQSIDVNGTASLTSIVLNGASISFGYFTTNGPSTLSGTIQHDNRMGGAASISVSINGNANSYVGTWVATRQ